MQRSSRAGIRTHLPTKEVVMSTTVHSATDVRPFHVDIPEEKLAELRRRIAATRWPSANSSPIRLKVCSRR